MRKKGKKEISLSLQDRQKLYSIHIFNNSRTKFSRFYVIETPSRYFSHPDRIKKFRKSKRSESIKFGTTIEMSR